MKVVGRERGDCGVGCETVSSSPQSAIGSHHSFPRRILPSFLFPRPAALVAPPGGASPFCCSFISGSIVRVLFRALSGYAPRATMSRALSTFGLAPDMLGLLAKAGFRTVGDLMPVGPLELSGDLSCTPEQALGVLQDTGLRERPSRPRPDLHGGSQSTESSGLGEFPPEGGSSVAAHASSVSYVPGTVLGSSLHTPVGTSALDLLHASKRARHIITFARGIDTMLGGGVPVGETLEFCGEPGIGKTQLGMQLALDAQIPCAFRGLGGKAVYIDTEGSFVAERAAEIARGVLKHLVTMGARCNGPQQAAAAKALTLQGLLSNIFCFRVHDYVEQVGV